MSRKIGNTLVALAASTVLAGGVLAVVPSPASAAPAPLGNILPNGLGSTPAQVKHNAQLLVSNDQGFDQAIAADNGVSVTSVAHSHVGAVSKKRCVLGTEHCINTGRDESNGSIVPTSFDNGTKVVSWSIELHISASRTITIHVMQKCGNPNLCRCGHPTPPPRPVKKVKRVVLKFHKSKTTHKRITCPSGQVVSVSVRTSVHGVAIAKVFAKAIELIVLKLKAQVKIDVKTTIKVVCKKYPPSKPIMTLSDGACVKAHHHNGVINVAAGNPNLLASKLVITVENRTKTVESLHGHATVNRQFSGFAPGKYRVTARLTRFHLSVSKWVRVHKCASPPPPPTCVPPQVGTPPDCKNPPSIVDVRKPQEIYSDGETFPICATANDTVGDQLLVTFFVRDADHPDQSGWGAFSPSMKTITGTGGDQVCTTFTSPNTPDAVGHADDFYVTITDLTENIPGTAGHSGRVPIMALP